MPGYVFTSALNDRIQAAEALFDPGSERVLATVPFARDGVALEVGAGGGSIARWLAAHMAPGGRVIATDVDLSALTADGNGENPPNLEVRRHDVVADPVEPTSYDLIHARLLLEHLPARLDVLGKLVSGLRPGGYLVVEDVDYAGAVPVTEHGRELHEKVQSIRLELFARNGVDHYLGRALPGLFRAAGLVDVGHDGRVDLMEGGSASARWLKLSLGFLRPRLTERGLLTTEEIDEMIELLDDPGFTAIGPVMFAAWGRKDG